MIKNRVNGILVFFANFNVVCNSEERFNSTFCKYTSDVSNHFIKDVGWKEFKMGWMKLTNFRKEGHKLYNIDRFLV